MSVRATISRLNFTTEHHQAATDAGHSLESLRNSAVLKTIEATNDLRLLLNLMPVGDPQIATITSQISKLQ
jgi:hypothetical protein